MSKRPESITEYLAYIDSDWGRGYIQRGRATKKGVHLSAQNLDLCEGNLLEGYLLSQIMYWADLNEDTLEPRLRHWEYNHLWIVKNHEDWQQELHLACSPETIGDALRRLTSRGLIVKETHKSPYHKGRLASFVRPEWKGIEAAICQLEQNDENPLWSPEQNDKNPLSEKDKNPPTFTESTPESIREDSAPPSGGARAGSAARVKSTSYDNLDGEEVTATGLENLIMEVTGSKELTEAQKARLGRAVWVETDKKSYPSPNTLYDQLDDEGRAFQEWARDRIAKRAQHSRLSRNDAVKMVSTYYGQSTDGVTYGWLTWYRENESRFKSAPIGEGLTPAQRWKRKMENQE